MALHRPVELARVTGHLKMSGLRVIRPADGNPRNSPQPPFSGIGPRSAILPCIEHVTRTNIFNGVRALFFDRQVI